MSAVLKSVGKMPFTLISVLVLFAQVAAAEVEPMHYRSNLFVTGDYVVASTSLGGLGSSPGTTSGSITIADVPCTVGIGAQAQTPSPQLCGQGGAVPAEIVSANLYWETVESVAGQGNTGKFDGNNITGQPLGVSSHPVACWGFGATPPSERLYVADVLRFLPFDGVNSVRLANGAHTVEFVNSPNPGNGNLPVTEGASLVVVYRVVVPGAPNIKGASLRSVVTYAGSSNMGQFSPAAMSMGGFYQLANSAKARMTWIVGDVSSKYAETLTVNEQIPAGLNNSNPFAGANPNGTPTQGGGWSALTFDVSDSILSDSLTGLHPGIVHTQVVAGNKQSPCLSFGVIVFSAFVQASDNDGIVDIAKKSGLHFNPGDLSQNPATFGDCTSYPKEPCLNLPAMGANPTPGAPVRPDIFIQLDWMNGPGIDGTGGLDGFGTHVHQPKHDALKAVCDAFFTKDPALLFQHKIAIHFDVGTDPAYQDLATAANNYCVVPAAYAQGGHNDPESNFACVDPPAPAPPCQYHEPFAVTSFKLGYQMIRDGNALYPSPGGTGIAQHMSTDRKDVFHYGLFGHSLAGPYDNTGKALPNTPFSTSGVGDRPGGAFMVTLGAWRSDIPDADMVGTWQQQAGTIMHELGHNLGLQHGGLVSSPQCGPNYPSVMSYSNQTRLLTRLLDGRTVPDYSNGLIGPFNESVLSLSPPGLVPNQNQFYKVRFYAPLNPSTNTDAQAAKIHCNGTPLTGDMAIRLESAAPDWTNGVVGTTFFDTNFDGITGQMLYDSPDWISLNLQQVSAQPVFGFLSAGIISYDNGIISYDNGIISYDNGIISYDNGVISFDKGIISYDNGIISYDNGVISFDNGAKDENQDTHNASSIDPPPPPSPDCPKCGLTATGEVSDILLLWTPPPSKVQSYNIYRCFGVCVPTVQNLFANAPGGAKPSFKDVVNDTSPLHTGAACPAGLTCYNTTYTYAVTALVLVNGNLNESAMSNTASGMVNHQFQLYIVTVAPMKSPAKSGSSVPTNFTVQDASTLAVISDLGVVKEIDSVFNGVPPAGSKCQVKQLVYQAPNFSEGKSNLRFVGNSDQFNWDTSSTLSANGGCGLGSYTLLITLKDGSVTPTGPVQLTK
jgi:hypothetical protein